MTFDLTIDRTSSCPPAHLVLVTLLYPAVLNVSYMHVLSHNHNQLCSWVFPPLCLRVEL